MRPDDFDFIARLLKDRSGLVLTKDKAYLLESRLMPIARRNGWKGLDELVVNVRRNDAKLIDDVVEAMTTNESFFFRDTKPFEQFREIVLPHMLDHRRDRRSFRIWSAACSSGQEPYSLAMILKEEAAKMQGWRVEIVGTDISNEILNKARAGQYSQFEVQRGLPIQLLVKYFQKQDDVWQIDSSIRAMVQYKKFNLLEDLKSLGKFDVVFCRNVLIYFDQQTKGHILTNVAGQMPDDGFLYLGGAETVLGISDHFKPIPNQRGVYALNRGTASSATVVKDFQRAGGAGILPLTSSGLAQAQKTGSSFGTAGGSAPRPGAAPGPAIARPGAAPASQTAGKFGTAAPAKPTAAPPRPEAPPAKPATSAPAKPASGATSTTTPGQRPLNKPTFGVKT